MWNYRITSVWGIPIRINVSLLVFLPVLAWLIGSGEQITIYTGIINGFTPSPLDAADLRAGNTPWLIGSLAAVGLFVSVALHELGHSWAARRYGIEVESITLWLLGGLANLQTIPREWQKEFWIAIAGPAASVLVAAVAYAAVLVVPASLPVVTFVFGWLVVTNLVLTVFNLLPAFPMDGGRVLRALLARSQPYATATRTAARVGALFALGFAILGVLSFSPLLLLLALFVYGGATSESRLVALDTLLDGVTAADVMTTDTERVTGDTTMADLATRMLEEGRTTYLVTGDDGTVAGIVSVDDFKRSRGQDTTVEEVMDTNVPRITGETSLFDVYGLMNRDRVDAAIVEADGEIRGVITSTQMATALQIRREAGSVAAPRTAM
ncbi:site-2 protease family protein [Halorussus sp. MSC15.2]|uniref:site-2 protease family protein n=1 Tax=Halorussus sp. MSC15.2 TaxID=2283638 RepID=UPI0013D26956|nr:site-2 protease family protein [Halorussus sp. MSC15.2]NEU57822.1 CBS domain-containing protein [Halorussus sp. MSC15.2]